MLHQFKNFISEKKLFAPDDKLLIAVSGGVDSIALAHLCSAAGLKFDIAHCNFGLRGKESEGDEKFVMQLAAKYNVRFFTTRFQTQTIADEQGISIQMAARQLRYEWFNKILKIEKHKYILTAHHKDDELETFFINIIRGTGIGGLHGIPVKRNKIVRPLLFASRANIEAYVIKHKLKYRADSSNASDKYLRNKLRHQVIPILKDMNPNLETTIGKNIERIQQVEQLYRQTIKEKKQTLFSTKGQAIHIDIKKLKACKPVEVFIYELLKPYGFNETSCKDVVHALTSSDSGQQYYSATHRLLKNRSHLIISPRLNSVRKKYVVAATTKKIIEPLILSFSKVKVQAYQLPTLPAIASLDYDKLKFPLVIRGWEKGDAFRPLGMKTNKKLSDFFIDNKLSLVEKENTWLLISGQDIVWVIGQRVDDRYKITEETKHIYRIVLNNL